MTANEWLGVMKQAQDFPKGMEKLIVKYGEMLIAEHESKVKKLTIPVVSNNEVAVCGLELRSCEYIGFSNKCNYAHECPHKEQTDC